MTTTKPNYSAFLSYVKSHANDDDDIFELNNLETECDFNVILFNGNIYSVILQVIDYFNNEYGYDLHEKMNIDEVILDEFCTYKSDVAVYMYLVNYFKDNDLFTIS